MYKDRDKIANLEALQFQENIPTNFPHTIIQ